jgi:hypothetical protein
MDELYFVSSRKGKPVALHKGFKYNLRTGKKNQNGTTLWRCTARNNCYASITIDSKGKQVLRENKDHQCRPNFVKKDIELLLTSSCRTSFLLGQFCRTSFFEIWKNDKIMGVKTSSPLFQISKNWFNKTMPTETGQDVALFRNGGNLLYKSSR